MNEDPGTNPAPPIQGDLSPYGYRVPTTTKQPESGLPGQSTTDIAAPATAPTIRPILAVTLLIIGWIVVLSLTVIGYTRYRTSTSFETTTVANENWLLYLQTIHDRLTTW